MEHYRNEFDEWKSDMENHSSDEFIRINNEQQEKGLPSMSYHEYNNHRTWETDYNKKIDYELDDYITKELELEEVDSNQLEKYGFRA